MAARTPAFNYPDAYAPHSKPWKQPKKYIRLTEDVTRFLPVDDPEAFALTQAAAGSLAHSATALAGGGGAVSALDAPRHYDSEADDTRRKKWLHRSPRDDKDRDGESASGDGGASGGGGGGGGGGGAGGGGGGGSSAFAPKGKAPPSYTSAAVAALKRSQQQGLLRLNNEQTALAIGMQHFVHTRQLQLLRLLVDLKVLRGKRAKAMARVAPRKVEPRTPAKPLLAVEVPATPRYSSGASPLPSSLSSPFPSPSPKAPHPGGSGSGSGAAAQPRPRSPSLTTPLPMRRVASSPMLAASPATAAGATATGTAVLPAKC